jgi:hypothetical protein
MKWILPLAASVLMAGNAHAGTKEKIEGIAGMSGITQSTENTVTYTVFLWTKVPNHYWYPPPTFHYTAKMPTDNGRTEEQIENDLKDVKESIELVLYEIEPKTRIRAGAPGPKIRDGTLYVDDDADGTLDRVYRGDTDFSLRTLGLLMDRPARALVQIPLTAEHLDTYHYVTSLFDESGLRDSYLRQALE